MAFKWEKISLTEGQKLLQNKWGMHFLLPDPEDEDEGIFQLCGEKLKLLNMQKVFPVAKFPFKGCTFYFSPLISKDDKYEKEYLLVFFEREGKIHVITTYCDVHQNTWVVPTYSDFDESDDKPRLGTGYETQETMTWPVPIQIVISKVVKEFPPISVNREPKVFECGVFAGDETPAIFWNEEAENEELVIDLGNFKQRDEKDAIVYQFIAGMEPDLSRLEKVGSSLHKILNREVELYYIPSSDSTVEYFVQYDSNLKMAIIASIQSSLNIPRDYTPFGLHGKTFTRKSLISYDATGSLVDKLTLPFCVPANKMPLGFGEDEESDDDDENVKLTYTTAYVSKIKTLQSIYKKIKEYKAQKAEEEEKAALTAKDTHTTSETTAQTFAPASTAPMTQPPQHVQATHTAPPHAGVSTSASMVSTPSVVESKPPSEADKILTRMCDKSVLNQDIDHQAPKPKGFTYNLFKNVDMPQVQDSPFLVDFMSAVSTLIMGQDESLRANYLKGLVYFINEFNKSSGPNSKTNHYTNQLLQKDFLKDIDALSAMEALRVLIKPTQNLHQGVKIGLDRIIIENKNKPISPN